MSSSHPMPHDTLYVEIEYNTQDQEYDPMYIATNDRIGLVAETFEELRENLKEALDACLGDIDTVAEYDLVPNPRIELRMPFADGETAKNTPRANKFKFAKSLKLR
jgi:predicted RNase H-like HicB family nuclease